MIRVWAVVCLLVLSALSFAQKPQATATGADQTGARNEAVLILPFHNESKAPGLEWIGEAFSEVLGQRMQSPSIFVISREDRLNALDRLGIPANAQLSRATLLRISEQMDVDYVVLGTFNYDGNTFASRAQLLDMRQLHLAPAVTESGSLLQLIDIQAATAWDLTHAIQPGMGATKQDFISETKDIRLDALENYVRGVTASGNVEKIRRLKEAVRLNPDYSVAMLELGKTYFAQRDYSSAVTWLSKIPQLDKHSSEANFYLGLAAYYSGSMDRSADAFRFVASRLPLGEIYNNLGVVEARRGKSAAAAEYIQKAADSDPRDEDYKFNVAVCLLRSGDRLGATRQLKEALSLRPGDTEAKNLLDSISLASGVPAKIPYERIKRNYDEASFRQLAFAIENAEELQMAQSDPKKHAAMHVDEGNQQLAQGFYESAREHFRKALALDPSNSEARIGLANAQIALNDFASARSELASALEAKATPDAYLALAQVDMKQNRLQAAHDDVEQALRLEPGNAAALRMKQQLASKRDPSLQQP